MRRFLFGLAAALLAAAPGSAHFLFVSPAPGGFAVVFNDGPTPDGSVRVEPFDGAKFTRVDAAGAKTVTAAQPAGPGKLKVEGSAAVVYGSVPYGVVLRGDPQPTLITYHPKTVTAPVTPGVALPPAGLPLELTPTATTAGVAFLVTESGRPLAGHEVLVYRPGDAKPTAVATGADGRTPAFDAPGEYAARTYRLEPTGDQEFQGRRYKNVRHYATLTATFGK